MSEHVDVIVVGAGLSGIGAAWHLQTHCPDRRYVILEGRAAMGGTWDLFRYPGIRSDSDMHTLGYRFRPWTGARAIADGAAIRGYIEDTARESGIDRHIRYGHKVVAASWSSHAARWTVEVERDGGERVTLTCDWLHMCAGYYDYARGHAPAFAGAGNFLGTIVHPQFWPSDLDCAGKRVVVIGSGATAMTLVPALAQDAAHVTMLQRSPTYVVSRPAHDPIADRLRAWLPPHAAYRITRWKNVLLGSFFFQLARRRPAKVRNQLVGMVRKELGDDYDVATHFTPRYDPWDQRLCLVPNADLFAAIRDGRASVVTDTIDRFTPDGVRLASGTDVPADVIVTATGLELSLLGGIAITRDGAAVHLPELFQYKGMMFSDVPNFSFTFGYTNASWTLKADLVAGYMCRLLNTMRRRGRRQATPRIGTRDLTEQPLTDFNPGYIQRAAALLPKQGDRTPWRLNQNYMRDVMALRFASVDDGMAFTNAVPKDGASA